MDEIKEENPNKPKQEKVRVLPLTAINDAPGVCGGQRNYGSIWARPHRIIHASSE